jgi:hypothetical protein
MRALLTLAAAAASLSACATYGDYGRDDDYRSGRYRYEGSAWASRHGNGPLRGPGADVLDPWLAETEEGNLIVRAGWRGARDGWIDPETAERANVWFRRYADADRDLCLTDAEIRAGLAYAAEQVHRPRRRYG